MLLPFFILGGAALLAFMQNGGSCYSKAVAAAKKQSAPDVFDAADCFRKRGDTATAGWLDMLGMRIQTAKAGGSLQPTETFDQDNTKNPAIAEMGGVLWNLENRADILEGWAAAFKRAKLPRMSDNLAYKASQLKALYK